MPSEKVGSLFVEVGVHGDHAVSEALALHEALKKIARDLTRLGSGANFNAVTSKLKAVNAQAQATAHNVAAATNPTTQAATQSKLLQQQINNAHTAAIAEDRERAASAARAVRQAERTGAAQTAAQARASAAVVAEANRASARQVAAAERASRDRERLMLREAYVMNRIFDKEARDAERSAARQVRAQTIASRSRAGAARRGSSDFATGGAALLSGNPAYAAANIAQGISKLTGAFGGMGIAATAGAAAIAAVGVAAIAAEVGIVALTVKITELGLKTAASFETSRIQFEGLLGSAREGKQEFDWLIDLGKTSIIPTESLIAADRQLVAFGVESKKQRRDLVNFISLFGTATTATEQQIYFLSLAVGQVAARGRADRVDFKQLGNAGIGTTKILKSIAEESGKSFKKVKADYESGKIGANDLIAGLTGLSDQYEKTAQRARNSTNGLLANMKDIVTAGLGRAFEGLNKQFGRLLRSVTDTINKIDFNAIVTGVQQFVEYIKDAFDGIGGGDGVGNDLVYFFNRTLPQAINIAGSVLGGAIRLFRLWVEYIQFIGNAIEGVVAQAIYDIASMGRVATDVLDKVGVLGDEEGELSRNFFIALQKNSEGALKNVKDDAVAIWSQVTDIIEEPLYIPLVFKATISDFVATGQVPKEALLPQTQAVQDILNGINSTTPKNDLTGTNKDKNSKALAAAKSLLDEWQQLVDQAIQGRDALRDAFIVPFSSKVLAGGGKAITQAFKQFSSSDVSTIIGQYKSVKQALVDYYTLAEQKGGSVGKKIVAQRKADIAFLKKQTGELVRLATVAEQINKKLAAAEEAYGKVTDAIDKQREAVGKQVDAQEKKINAQYDGFYTAISKTSGKFTKGSIAVAQDALDAATTAYEAAQAKLDDLKSARDDFLRSMQEMALSFVNDLSKVKQEITVFTRLDNVGSFSQVTKEIADTRSFTQGLKDRLTALKNFAANVKALIAKGLDKGLVQTLLQGGVDQNGAIVSELAGASAGEIADINSVQQDLARTITGMQKDASAAWFDAGIAAQEAFTSPLKAAMTAAQTQVDELNRQKELALGILEAWHADQNALFDQQEEVAKTQYEKQKADLEAALKANQKSADAIAAQIDARFKKIPTTAYATGLNTIDGIIKGLKDNAKLAELRAAANRIASIIQSTIRAALRINSPSQVMIEMGQYVGQGLAVGMGLSEPLVSDAAMGLASAAIPSIPGSGKTTVVKVYLSDKELQELVDGQIEVSDGEALNYLTTGARF